MGLASMESLVPIIASTIFTNLYNATIGLQYPWKGTFYFVGATFTATGALVSFFVYLSLGCTQIKSEEEEEEEKSFKRQSSNLHPDDMISKRAELMCVAFSKHKHFD